MVSTRTVYNNPDEHTAAQLNTASAPREVRSECIASLFFILELPCPYFPDTATWVSVLKMSSQ